MKYLIILLAIVSIAFIGCDQNKVLNSDEQISRVDMDITGLQAMGDSIWYEAWIVWLERGVSGDTEKFQSIGLLEFDQGGNLETKSFDINIGYLQAGLTVLITIEEDNIPGYIVKELSAGDSTYLDSTEGPSSYNVIAADIVANGGTFKIGNPRVLDFDFDMAEATYILNTPTDPSAVNPLSGFWFVKLDTTFINDTLFTVTNTEGLELPELSGGWKYEAWMVMDGDSFSLGTFTSPVGADASAAYSGSAKGYAFPGEDFIFDDQDNPWRPNLTGAEIFVQINAPHPAKSPYPFSTPIKPFSVTIPAGSVPMKNYKMDNQSTQFPGGDLSIEIEIYE